MPLHTIARHLFRAFFFCTDSMRPLCGMGFVNHCQSLKTVDNSQQQMALMGNTKRPLRQHSETEISACKSKVHACRIALMHSGYTQETVAERLGKTAGYMSLLMNGKRRWTDDLQFRFEQITGSLAPTQWDAARRGLAVYVDDVAVRKAQLHAELAELEQVA